MSICVSTEAPASKLALDELRSNHLSVFRYDGVTYLVDSDGAKALRCADRSHLLNNIPEAQGCTKLPLTLDSLNLWQAAVAAIDSNGLPPEWLSHTRAHDLSTLATVSEFLGDGDTLNMTVQALASMLEDALKPKKHSDSSEDAPIRATRASHIFTAMIGMNSSLQTAVFSITPLPLSVLVPVVPKEMLLAVVQRHVLASQLDISEQLLPPPGTISCNDAEPISTSSSKSTHKLSLRELLPSLASLRSLQGIDVSRNGLMHDSVCDSENLSALASLIRMHASSLESFKLSEESSGVRESSIVLWSIGAAGEVWQAVAECAALKRLDLSYEYLDNLWHYGAVSHMLYRLSGLQDLDLSGTMRLDLMRAVTHMTNLTALAIADSNILPGSNSLRFPGDLLHLTMLQRLDISGNACDVCPFLATLAISCFMPSLSSMKAERMSVVKYSKQLSDVTPERACKAIDKIFWSEGRDAAMMNQFITYPPRVRLGNLSCSGVENLSSSVKQQSIDRSRGSASSTGSSVSIPAVGTNLKSLSLKRITNSSKIAKQVLQFMLTPFAWQTETGNVKMVPATPMSEHTWSPVDALQNLTALNMSNVPMGRMAEEGGCLAQFVGRLRALQDLNLSDCVLAPSCLSSLCRTLSEELNDGKVVGITSLDWSDNQSFDGANVWDALCGVTSLRSLTLQHCGIGSDQAKKLSQYLPGTLVNLTRLDLARNSIRSDGLEAVSQVCNLLAAYVDLRFSEYSLHGVRR